MSDLADNLACILETAGVGEAICVGCVSFFISFTELWAYANVVSDMIGVHRHAMRLDDKSLLTSRESLALPFLLAFFNCLGAVDKPLIES
jgi:hypothetical protein